MWNVLVPSLCLFVSVIFVKVLGHNETQFLHFLNDDDIDLTGNRTTKSEGGEVEDYFMGQYETFEEDDEEIDEQVLNDFKDLDVDDFDVFFKGRWSYAPGFVEKLCRTKCQKAGKHFGRLLGARCRCYCPLNAPDLNLCSASGVCDKFCASIKFYKGGDCVFNNVCFCYCKPAEEYDVRVVYTLATDATTTATTTPAPPPVQSPTTNTTNSAKTNRPRPKPSRPRPLSLIEFKMQKSMYLSM